MKITQTTITVTVASAGLAALPAGNLENRQSQLPWRTCAPSSRQSGNEEEKEK
jgi:hypothetical protein